MPKEELRNRLGMQSRDFNAALARLSEDGVIQEADATARLPSHVPDLSDAQRRQADEYLALLGSNPYSPPTDAPVDPSCYRHFRTRVELFGSTRTWYI